MKKMILIATAILGTAAASQAGVHFDFGINVPLPGELILGHRAPAPVVYPAPPPVISRPPVSCQPVPGPACALAPAPIIDPQPVYCPPPAPMCAAQVVITPRPYYAPRHDFYSWRHDERWHRYGRGWDGRDDRDNWHRR